MTTLDLSNHPEVVAIRRELDAAWPPDMLGTEVQPDWHIWDGLQAYAILNGVSVVTARQQSVLTEGNE